MHGVDEGKSWQVEGVWEWLLGKRMCGKEGKVGEGGIVRGHQETGDNRTLWAATQLTDCGPRPEDVDEFGWLP